MFYLVWEATQPPHPHPAMSELGLERRHTDGPITFQRKQVTRWAHAVRAFTATGHWAVLGAIPPCNTRDTPNMAVNCHAGISRPPFLLPRDKFARCRNQERGRGRLRNADTVTSWCVIKRQRKRESARGMGRRTYDPEEGESTSQKLINTLRKRILDIGKL